MSSSRWSSGATTADSPSPRETSPRGCDGIGRLAGAVPATRETSAQHRALYRRRLDLDGSGGGWLAVAHPARRHGFDIAVRRHRHLRRRGLRARCDSGHRLQRPAGGGRGGALGRLQKGTVSITRSRKASTPRTRPSAPSVSVRGATPRSSRSPRPNGSSSTTSSDSTARSSARRRPSTRPPTGRGWRPRSEHAPVVWSSPVGCGANKATSGPLSRPSLPSSAIHPLHADGRVMHTAP